MSSHLLRHYWIVHGRNLIKRAVSRCVRCARFSTTQLHQQMGPLPTVRVTPTPPFQFTGVDYAGPIWMTATRGRGRKATKGYLALFVCMTTKAVHIEVVSDYTSTTFVAALRRFISCRGKPKTIFCDNGTTFKGAESELHRVFANSSADGIEIAGTLARDVNEWTYTPPKGPHFSGLWEANIKSMKMVLRSSR